MSETGMYSKLRKPRENRYTGCIELYTSGGRLQFQYQL